MLFYTVTLYSRDWQNILSTTLLESQVSRNTYSRFHLPTMERYIDWRLQWRVSVYSFQSDLSFILLYMWRIDKAVTVWWNYTLRPTILYAIKGGTIVSTPIKALKWWRDSVNIYKITYQFNHLFHSNVDSYFTLLEYVMNSKRWYRISS